MFTGKVETTFDSDLELAHYGMFMRKVCISSIVIGAGPLCHVYREYLHQFNSDLVPAYYGMRTGKDGINLILI